MHSHMTGSFAGGSPKNYQGAVYTIHFLSIDLAKLNPNCHMNYSIIFTEISFSPETSNFFLNYMTCERLLKLKTER